jgi:hypothetical protein
VAFGSGVNTIAGSPNFTYLSALGALILKNDGTNGVPQITLFDTSAVLGDANQNALYFAANNSAATQVAYAVIYATQINRTAGTETGELSFIVRNAGNPVEALSIQALGIGDMLVLPGKTSGQASFAAAPIAGTPNPFFLPTTTGLPGQFLRTDGANPQQTSWGSGISPNGYVSCTDVTPCAAAATTILTSAAADSQYALNASVDCTSAVAAATAQLVVTYTDPSNTLQTITPSAAACTALGAGSVINITTTVRVKASTAIQYAVTPTNSPTYQASVAAILEGN